MDTLPFNTARKFMLANPPSQLPTRDTATTFHAFPFYIAWRLHTTQLQRRELRLTKPSLRSPPARTALASEGAAHDLAAGSFAARDHEIPFVAFRLADSEGTSATIV